MSSTPILRGRGGGPGGFGGPSGNASAAASSSPLPPLSPLDAAPRRSTQQTSVVSRMLAAFHATSGTGRSATATASTTIASDEMVSPIPSTLASRRTSLEMPSSSSSPVTPSREIPMVRLAPPPSVFPSRAALRAASSSTRSNHLERTIFVVREEENEQACSSIDESLRTTQPLPAPDTPLPFDSSPALAPLDSPMFSSCANSSSSSPSPVPMHALRARPPSPPLIRGATHNRHRSSIIFPFDLAAIARPLEQPSSSTSSDTNNSKTTSSAVAVQDKPTSDDSGALVIKDSRAPVCSTAPTTSSAVPSWCIWVIYTSMFIDCLVMTFPISFLSVQLEEAGVSLLATGFVFGAKSLFQLLANPLLGILVNRAGHELPMYAGMLLLIASTMSMAFVPVNMKWYAVLLIARAVQGIASTATYIAGTNYLTVVFRTDAERGVALSNAMLAYGAASVAGPVLGSVFYSIGGQMLAYLVLAGMAGGQWVLLFVAFRHTPVAVHEAYQLMRTPMSVSESRRIDASNSSSSSGKKDTVCPSPSLDSSSHASSSARSSISMPSSSSSLLAFKNLIESPVVTSRSPMAPVGSQGDVLFESTSASSSTTQAQAAAADDEAGIHATMPSSVPRAASSLSSFLLELRPLTDPYVLVPCLVLMTIQAALSNLQYQLPIYLDETYGASSLIIGISMLPSMVGYVICAPLAGRFGSRIAYGRHKFVVAGCALMAIALILLTAPSSLVGMIMMGIPLGGGLGFIECSTSAMLAQLLDARHSNRTGYGVAFALADLSVALGFFGGALIGALVSQSMDFAWSCRAWGLGLFVLVPCVYVARLGVPAFAVVPSEVAEVAAVASVSVVGSSEEEEVQQKKQGELVKDGCGVSAHNFDKSKECAAAEWQQRGRAEKDAEYAGEHRVQIAIDKMPLERCTSTTAAHETSTSAKLEMLRIHDDCEVSQISHSIDHVSLDLGSVEEPPSGVASPGEPAVVEFVHA